MAMPTPRTESLTNKEATGMKTRKSTGIEKGARYIREPTRTQVPLPPLNLMGNIQLCPIEVNTTASMGING